MPADIDGAMCPPCVPPEPAGASAAPEEQGRPDGTPWDTWIVAGFGRIVYNATEDSLGAHCTKHGSLCRANKVCKRSGLGYLVAFLQASHLDCTLNTKAKHMDVRRPLCSAAGLEARRAGRKFLLDREAMYRDLLALERRYNPSLQEPETVRG